MDALITVLGKTQPKAKYILKGIKKSKNRPIVASEISTQIQLDFYSHEKDETRIVKEVSVVNRFEKIKSSFGGFVLLGYTSELLDQLLPDGESHTAIYKLYLEFLNTIDENGYSPLIMPFFKIKLLAAVGLFSGEFRCIFCNMDVLEKKSAFINSENWEVTCGDCQNIQKNTINEIRLFNAIMKNRYLNLKNKSIPLPQIIEIDYLLNSYLKIYIGKPLKSANILYKSLKENYEFLY